MFAGENNYYLMKVYGGGIVVPAACSLSEEEEAVMLTGMEVAKVLRDNGYKVTPQRLAVYDSLAHTKEHPNAEMLYAQLQPKFPSMSFATVYKSIEILNKLHLIKVLNTGEESFRYDADVSNHQHIQCLCCGRVDDLRMDTEAFVREAEAESGYTIQNQEAYFYGICPECRKKAAN
jgi:Fur family peroxide stress response transcriptional regulator